MPEYPGRFIAALYRKAQSYWTQTLKEISVSAAEYPVLLLLYQEDGRTQESLSRELLVDKSAITRVIQSLLKKGLITRCQDETDRRCNRIFLTARAEQCKEKVEQARVHWNELLLQHMLPEEQSQLYRLLELALNNVKESDIR